MHVRFDIKHCHTRDERARSKLSICVTGMQRYVISDAEPWGLPLELKILPQHLKDAGYDTHLVGKWHLGFFRHEYTPNYRGFDSFFGYYQGHQDYFTHRAKESVRRPRY